MSTRRKRVRKADRLASLIPLVLVLLACSGYAAYRAADQHGQYVRSQRTQHDGVRVGASITSTRTVQHRFKGGTSYDSYWAVRLDRPLDGRRTTTVHVAGQSTPPAGDRRAIALDPRDGGYAEVVGEATRTNLDWAGSAVVSVLLVLLSVFVVFRVVRRRMLSRGTGPSRST